MPSLAHSLGDLNPRNVARREERAREIARRLPVEFAGSIIALRKARVALEKLLLSAAKDEDANAVCRISDSLVRVTNAFADYTKEAARKKKSQWDSVVLNAEPVSDAEPAPVPTQPSC